MEKYKLINTTTKEEHLCDKVTIDGFDYYVNNFISDEVDGDLKKIPFEKLILIAVATNNTSIDIPQVGAEVEKISDKLLSLSGLKSIDGTYKSYHYQAEAFLKGIKEGYAKSQETHPFSENDIEFFVKKTLEDAKKSVCWSYEYYKHLTKELVQNWKEQKPKVVYYQ